MGEDGEGWEGCPVGTKLDNHTDNLEFLVRFPMHSTLNLIVFLKRFSNMLVIWEFPGLPYYCTPSSPSIRTTLATFRVDWILMTGSYCEMKTRKMEFSRRKGKRPALSIRSVRFEISTIDFVDGCGLDLQPAAIAVTYDDPIGGQSCFGGHKLCARSIEPDAKCTHLQT